MNIPFTLTASPTRPTRPASLGAVRRHGQVEGGASVPMSPVAKRSSGYAGSKVVTTISPGCPGTAGLRVSIVEVLDLETRKPAVPGQPGEIVVTTFDPAYPLLRFATGDIGTLAPPSTCPCLRTAPKLAGLVGRVGDAVKVKGMFIRGAEIENALKAFPVVARFQAVVTRDQHQDHLAYVLELSEGASPEAGLEGRIADALREAIKVRGEVRISPRGTLPEGAKRIDDRRTWR